MKEFAIHCYNAFAFWLSMVISLYCLSAKDFNIKRCLPGLGIALAGLIVSYAYVVYIVPMGVIVLVSLYIHFNKFIGSHFRLVNILCGCVYVNLLASSVCSDLLLAFIPDTADATYNLIMGILILAVCAGAMPLLNWLGGWLKSYSNSGHLFSITYKLLFIVIFSLILPQLTEFTYEHKILLHVGFYILAIYLILLFLNFSKVNQDLQRMEEQLGAIPQYHREVELFTKQASRINHNMDKKLIDAGLLFYLKDDYKGWRNYFENLIKIHQDMIQENKHLERIEDKDIRYFLYYCHIYAQAEKKRRIDFFIPHPVRRFGMETNHLLQLLTVYLENALEWSLPDMEITVHFIQDEKSVTIRIENVYSQLIEPDKDNGSGNGLKYAKDIINQYPNVEALNRFQEYISNDFSTNKRLYTAQITIYEGEQ